MSRRIPWRKTVHRAGYSPYSENIARSMELANTYNDDNEVKGTGCDVNELMEGRNVLRSMSRAIRVKGKRRLEVEERN